MEQEPAKIDAKSEERLNLQSQLLSAVKRCQSRFGGRSELATELDNNVKTLCSVLEQVFSHGLRFKNQEKKNSTLKQVTDLVLGNGEQYSLWDFVQTLLTRHECERYELLRQIWTDRGRARAWLRSAINERSLERYMATLLRSNNLGIYYEDWAFVRNQENSNILSDLAAGLSSILFALSIDRPELNQAPNDSQAGFSSHEEPIILESDTDPVKKKVDNKKHKKAALKIISFGDEEIIESPIKNECLISTFHPTSTEISKHLVDEVTFGDVECAEEATGIICVDGDGSNSDSDAKLEEGASSSQISTSGLMPINNSSMGALTPVAIADETHSSEDSISVPSFSEDNEHAVSSSNTEYISESGDANNEDNVSRNQAECLNQLQKYKELSNTLQSQLTQTSQQFLQKIQQLESEVNELNRENEVLKHQLRKYVNAVQMMKIQGDEFEGDELYQQKLVQVAEMHSELMELNDRLQRNNINKDNIIKRLYLELEALRGPLGPSEIDVSAQLISLWVPSVFLTGMPKQHHVYQVHLRIGEEEWNVYRRYSQFLTLHKDFKKQYPVISAFKFPPKKTIGNKDAKFVEERRLKLQQYLRRLLNHIVANNPQLTNAPSKSNLISVIPLFGEPNDSPTERRPRVTYPRSTTNSPQYSGL